MSIIGQCTVSNVVSIEMCIMSVQGSHIDVSVICYDKVLL